MLVLSGLRRGRTTGGVGWGMSSAIKFEGVLFLPLLTPKREKQQRSLVVGVCIAWFQREGHELIVEE